MEPNTMAAISNAAKGLVSGLFGDGGITKLIDNVTTTKEEKMKLNAEMQKIQNDFEVKLKDHLLELKKLELEERKAFLQDTADARESNSKIQESQSASWLAKNVAYLLDIFIFTVWGAMTVYLILMMLNFVKADKGADVSGVLGVYSGITAIAMTVLNFHRGTSRGSEEKQKQISSMMSK